jgi:hypothetical protein
MGARAATGVNEPDGLGRTPLHYAAGRGRAAACELLLRRGARAQHADAAGFAPLHRAAAAGHAAAAAALLAWGADANRRTGGAERATPLMLAARAGAADCVAALLAGGADPAAECAAGRTAAEWAGDAPPELLALLRPHLGSLGRIAGAGWDASSLPARAREQASSAPSVRSAGSAVSVGDAERARTDCIRQLRQQLRALEAGRPAGPADGPRIARLQAAVRTVGAAIAELGDSLDASGPARRWSP